MMMMMMIMTMTAEQQIDSCRGCGKSSEQKGQE
jgi:hypothetical protein